MIRLLRRAFVLLPAAAAWAGLLWAEDAFPLRAVEFRGNRHFSSEALARLTRLEIGAPVRKADFNAALRHLGAVGVFERLEYKYAPLDGGYRVTFIVEEMEDLFPVRFDGFDAPDAEIRRMLAETIPLFGGGVPPRVPLAGPIVSSIGNALQRWWEQRGNEEKVEGRLVFAGNEQAMLFTPQRSEARRTNRIAFVRFRNTGSLSPLELQRKFNQVAMGEAYSEERLRELLEHNVRPLYAEAGYMNVKFCPCRAEPDPDTQGLLVEVQVKQGEIYKVGEAVWPQPMPVDARNLSKINRIVPGATVNMTAAYDTMAVISESMKRQGYMKAQATFETEIDHEAKLVHFEISIVPGALYAFSRLVVRGLDILSEPAVRKRWGMQAGAPFDIRYPAYFLERIKADAMFENLKGTNWRIDIDETRKTVDVALIFSGNERRKGPAPIIEKPETPF